MEKGEMDWRKKRKKGTNVGLMLEDNKITWGKRKDECVMGGKRRQINGCRIIREKVN